jgi:murein DD-endopeptidase MepM/ murein hydrolase activator NlpD
MADYYPIFGSTHPIDQWVVIDLSEHNPQLDFNKTAEPEYLDRFVRSHFNQHKTVAVGGYGEKRATYLSAGHFSDKPEADIRCIHLGIDLWVEAGTKVYAPLDGVVHSFADNDLPFDYGPTIILKHESPTGSFFSLYGHLSVDSIEGLTVGQAIKRGELLAKIGTNDINGGWSPHLHIQIMKDMLGWEGDFPGAASSNDLLRYLENCPDPAFLLNLTDEKDI